jgi:germination protein M
MKRLSPIVFLAAAFVLGLGLAACGGDDATVVGESPTATAPASEPTTEAGTTTEPAPSTTTPTTTPAPDVSYKIWFLRGEQLATVDRTHEATPRVGTAALQDLLAGPTAKEAAEGLSTAIPEGTRLLGLVVSDRIATVDLSSEFESGGGSLSMMARLAQVTCTLDRFSSVDGVRFELDGEPVEVFSGEGIVLDHPVGCGDYDSLVLDGGSGGEDLPAIVVERPSPGDQIRSGTKVTGSANVFEANVSYFLIANEVVYDEGFTTATCGTGCRGTFSFRLRFEVDEPVDATLVVHDDDAAGVGEPPHSVRIPVRLMPS